MNYRNKFNIEIIFSTTYVNPDRSFPNILIIAILNTRLEDTVNIPDIPEIQTKYDIIHKYHINSHLQLCDIK